MNVSDTDNIPARIEEAKRVRLSDINKKVASIHLKFQSGNSTAVSRAYITRDEYNALATHLDDLYAELLDAEGTIREQAEKLSNYSWANSVQQGSL